MSRPKPPLVSLALATVCAQNIRRDSIGINLNELLPLSALTQNVICCQRRCCEKMKNEHSSIPKHMKQIGVSNNQLLLPLGSNVTI